MRARRPPACRSRPRPRRGLRARARARRQPPARAGARTPRPAGSRRGARVAGGRRASRSSAFAGIDDVCALVLDHVRAGRRITIHGDYDVDGVCSTAILVGVLRSLGARRRLVSAQPRGGRLRPVGSRPCERLAARGTRLLITADCAITAVDEVAAARAAGIEVVVTDHHSPRADGVLPDAPIVHPAVCGYPCVDLCAAGVAYKLVRRAAAGRGPRSGARRPRPRPRRARDDRRLRPAARREPPPRARRPARARRHEAPRPARADARRPRRPGADRHDRRRLPARAADQRRRPARARRRRARAAADRRRDPRGADRRRARPPELRAPPHRDADPLRGRGDGRARRRAVVLRARGRGLAQGRDRDRRVAHRRAPPPPRGADRAGSADSTRHGLRALDPGLRPARRP